MQSNDNTAIIDEDLSDRVNAQLLFYAGLFAIQIKHAGGWPVRFEFPAPSSEIESEALRIFLDEIEAQTSKRPEITYPQS